MTLSYVFISCCEGRIPLIIHYVVKAPVTLEFTVLTYARWYAFLAVKWVSKELMDIVNELN